MYHLPTRGRERHATWRVMADNIARPQICAPRAPRKPTGGHTAPPVAHESGDSFGKAGASWCRCRCANHSELFIQLAARSRVRSKFTDETRRPRPQGDFGANVSGLSVLSRRYTEQFIVRSHQELCSHGDLQPASYHTVRPRGSGAPGCSNAVMRRIVANDAGSVSRATPHRRIAKKSRSRRAASSSPTPG
jgi:hypothetical protein